MTRPLALVRLHHHQHLLPRAHDPRRRRTGSSFPLLVQKFVGETTKGTRLGRAAAVEPDGRAAVAGSDGHAFRPQHVALRPAAAVHLRRHDGHARLPRPHRRRRRACRAWPASRSCSSSRSCMAFAANTAHGAQQGLIPDLVPDEQRGRFSAVKAMLEIPIPLILVSFTIARFIKRATSGWRWALAARRPDRLDAADHAVAGDPAGKGGRAAVRLAIHPAAAC